MPKDKAFRLRADEIKPLAMGYGPCIASDMITVDGRKVGYMYREDGDTPVGWHFWAGQESPDYMDNPDNHGVYDVNTIANYDPDIIPLLNAAPGSVFRRDKHGKLAREHSGHPDGTIGYCNTDLDVASAEDLTSLAAALEAGGVSPLNVSRWENDGLWHGAFETDWGHAEPEPNIAEMLAVIESLPEPFRAVWDRCTLREFNIGYDCGDQPWAFNQGLSNELLGRMAAVGATLRITIYPERSPTRSAT